MQISIPLLSWFFCPEEFFSCVQTAPSTGPDVLACSPLFFHPFPFPLIFLWTDSRIENLNWTSQILWWIVSWICGAQHVAFSGQCQYVFEWRRRPPAAGSMFSCEARWRSKGWCSGADFWIKKCPDFQVVWTHLRYFLVFFWPFLDLSHGSQLSLEDMTFRNTFCHCQWNGIEIHATSNMKLFTMKNGRIIFTTNAEILIQKKESLHVLEKDSCYAAHLQKN